jgi:hypothetical protein
MKSELSIVRNWFWTCKYAYGTPLSKRGSKDISLTHVPMWWHLTTHCSGFQVQGGVENNLHTILDVEDMGRDYRPTYLHIIKCYDPLCPKKDTWIWVFFVGKFNNFFHLATIHVESTHFTDSHSKKKLRWKLAANEGEFVFDHKLTMNVKMNTNENFQ